MKSLKKSKAQENGRNKRFEQSRVSSEQLKKIKGGFVIIGDIIAV